MKFKITRWTSAVALAGLLLIGLLLVLEHRERLTAGRPLADQQLSPFQIMAAAASSAADDFAPMPSSWDFTFPNDHGSHPDYRTEWWQFTGTVFADARDPLGMHLLLVRIGLRSQPGDQMSAWTAPEIYAGLVSITDPSDGRSYTGQRLSRGALELAGATVEPVNIWIEDWRAEEIGIGEHGSVDLSLRAGTADFELDLELRSAQPLVDASELGGASSAQAAPFQFYVQPRMDVNGTIVLNGRASTSQGKVVMEHAWGELPLPGGPVASDRFTLHFDERVLLVVRTHRTDGTGTPTASGLLVAGNGRAVVLSNDDIQFSALEHWTSPRTEARYPIRWRMYIPEQDIDIELVPYWEDQEGAEWIRFWAGPVSVRSRSTNEAGQGYVQLYGYEPQ